MLIILQMVAAARKETEAAEKRNEQLKQQLADADLLQKSLQEQMHDLKSVMEKMSERDELESNTLPTTTAPSTPGITPADKMSKMFEAMNLTPNTPGSEEIAPENPLHFSHLINPVLRCDVTSFKDFQEMFRNNTRSAPSSRVSSGNYSSLNVLGLGSLTNGSTSSLPSAVRSPSSASAANSPRESLTSVAGLNLKDEKFYKRAVSEDIEPTLRLDIAPGLSWMARRTMLNSITAGSLVVEPNPPSKFRGPVFPCGFCGESRKEEPYARRFRCKTSETEETKYPLCDWCLGRVRATCDYIAFLRMIAAGHWRGETEDEKKNAWEESVRLRERMFWSRIGGGVVPSFIPLRESPRSPTFGHKTDSIRTSEESRVSETRTLDSVPEVTIPKTRKNEEDPFQAQDGDLPKRISIGKMIISSKEIPAEDSPAEDSPAESPSQEEEKKIEEEAEAQLQDEVRKSLEIKVDTAPKHQRAASTPGESAPAKKDERLSLTIPGSFD